MCMGQDPNRYRVISQHLNDTFIAIVHLEVNLDQLFTLHSEFKMTTNPTSLKYFMDAGVKEPIEKVCYLVENILYSIDRGLFNTSILVYII